MDFKIVTEFLSNTAFPIVAFVLLFWYIKDDQNKMREVIQANTNALTALLEHFHHKGEI